MKDLDAVFDREWQVGDIRGYYGQGGRGFLPLRLGLLRPGNTGEGRGARAHSENGPEEISSRIHDYPPFGSRYARSVVYPARATAHHTATIQ